MTYAILYNLTKKATPRRGSVNESGIHTKKYKNYLCIYSKNVLSLESYLLFKNNCSLKINGEAYVVNNENDKLRNKTTN
jgi:hypothetical protein